MQPPDSAQEIVAFASDALANAPHTPTTLRPFVKWCQLRWTRCGSLQILLQGLLGVMAEVVPRVELDRDMMGVYVYDRGLYFSFPAERRTTMRENFASVVRGSRRVVDAGVCKKIREQMDCVRFVVRVLAALEITFGHAYKDACVAGMLAKPFVSAVSRCSVASTWPPWYGYPLHVRENLYSTLFDVSKQVRAAGGALRAAAAFTIRCNTEAIQCRGATSTTRRTKMTAVRTTARKISSRQRAAVPKREVDDTRKRKRPPHRDQKSAE